MDANLVLWIGQILLALGFLAAGYPAPVAYGRFVVALGVTMSMSPTRTVSKVDDRRGRSRWTPGSSHSV